MRRRIIATLIVAAGLASAGIAYAENQPADPSVPGTSVPAVSAEPSAGEAPTVPAEAPAKARANDPAKAAGQARRLKAGILKGAIHGDLLVRNEDGSTRTVTFDRGKITAISGGSISIERPDGVSVSKALTDQTVFNGTPHDQLQAGMGVIVVSDGDTAHRVLSKGARKERAAKACANAPAAAAPDGVRARVKERICQRIEQRSAVVDDGLETILS
jgi:hypothetical protein